MTDDPIMAALDEVDAEGEHVNPGEGQPGAGEEPDAMPEGPAPDLPGEEVEEESGFSVLSWAERIPDGSHLDFDARDWWDPETGGKNRLAYHLSDATGEGAGYPNALGVLVAVAELYWSSVRNQSSTSEESEGAPDAEEVDRDTAEGLV